MLKTLQEAINHPLECEEQQLKNWLKQLEEYIKRDTPMKIQHMNLCGNSFCPACGEKMALTVENFCDKCGQRINKGSE